jgi:geranylgeranyl diphosphate synthase, type II
MQDAAPDLIGPLLARAVGLADAALERWIPPADVWPNRLHAAMRYSVFAGGKRLRPALVLASAEACGENEGSERLAAAMAAIEMFHTFTLIHDDLPAMDDDDLRRGVPTCHKAFDEPTAILAGDALQALAFEACAMVSATAVRDLARAAGSVGVIGGQQEDLEAEGQPVDQSRICRDRLEQIHRTKTAALLRASCLLGAHASDAGETTKEALATYGEELGLAFQIADDILDATATAEVLGKTPGKDAAQGKLTWVAVYGLDAARRAAAEHAARAIAALADFGPDADDLRCIARFVVERDR